MAGNQGLGSDNMSQADKDRIHSEGGKASNSGGNTTSRSTTTGRGSVTKNSQGGGALDKEAQKRGGQNSHNGGNS